MRLRPYQSKVLKELEARAEKEVVLSAAPSSGKTFMVIEYIKRHPEKTFLVLTHGTNVLKKQWEQEFEKHGVEASAEIGSKVTFGIPQALHKKKLNKVDVLIIDEAHEFNFAKKSSKEETYESMVNKIKKKIKPKKSIYLTGTPSKFIKAGIKPIIVPAIELINQGYVSDLYVSLVSTNADLSHLNADDNLKRASIKSMEENVGSTMDNLLDAMIERLREPDSVKSKPTGRLVLKHAALKKKLQKTMIACESVVQARKVEAYLEKKGIKTVQSNYQNDPESLLIDEFIETPDIKVLVVVQRGILGFNMPELVNVVDMTGSRNIDRIYQLFARVMRKNDAQPKKYFFKVTDEPGREMTKFYMNAALQLMMPDFISRYNGKNLGECQIPVFKYPKSKGQGNKRAKRNAPRAYPIDKLFQEQVLAGALLQDIWNKIGRSANEYAYTTFDLIRKENKYKDSPWLFFQTLEDWLGWDELQKYSSLAEWQKGHNASYQIAYKLGIQREIVKELELETKKPNNYWNKDTCLEEAKKYSSLAEWEKESTVSYRVALKLGITKDIAEELGWKAKKPNNYWNKDTCLEEAKKYSSLAEWQKGHYSSYDAAKKRGIQREIARELGWKIRGEKK